MCMFSKPVDVVSNTKLIYALLTDPQSGRRYALQTYENRVKLSAGQPHTTMILPVPVASINSVKLCNDQKQTAAVEQLFQLLHDRFAAQDRASTQDLFGGFGGFNLSGAAPASMLPVVKSGSYMVSIAPSIDAMDKCDNNVFELHNDELKTLLTEAAGNTKFVYIVAVLQASAEYHPFAYVYELEKDAKDAFIPTMHFHPHVATMLSNGVSSASGWSPFGQSALYTCKIHPDVYMSQSGTCKLCMAAKFALDAPFAARRYVADDWDHEIMVLGVRNVASAVGAVIKLIDAHFNSGHVNTKLRLLRDIVPAGANGIMMCEPFAHRIVVKGAARNVDISFPLSPLLHEGFHCDECRQPIRDDRRYHCMACSNIDLCAACEAKDTRAIQQTGFCSTGHPFVLLKTALQVEVFNQIQTRARAGSALRTHLASIEEGMNWMHVKVKLLKEASEQLSAADRSTPNA